MRTKARKDSNQDTIVKELRDSGISVATIHQVGRGVPDILCGFRGYTYIFEIKDPDKSPSKRRLTDEEEKWHQQWRGQVDIIHTADDAINIMQKNSLQ